MNLQEAILLLPGLVVGVTVHETAHALTAKWLGDDTAEQRGRISLNPLKHLSLVGTLAIFLVGFGWGKPVPINAANFRRPNLGFLISSVAGPISNLILCAAALGILYFRIGGLFALFFTSIFIVNAILAVINLLPIPPLDGSRIWPCLIPGLNIGDLDRFGSIWLIILLVLLFTGVIDAVIGPVLGFLYCLLPA